MCSLKALSKIMHLPQQSESKCVFKVTLLHVLWWYLQMIPKIVCLYRCKVTSVAFVWLLSTVSFQMRSQIGCMNKFEITLVEFV